MPLILLALGCLVPPGAELKDTGQPVQPDPVAGTFVMLDALSGDPRTDVTLTSSYGEVVETPDGEGTVQLLPGGFLVTASADDARDHRLVGVAGDEDFTLLSYMSNRTLTGQVMGLLARAADPAKGFLVVGLDHPDLSPAVGASVEIDAAYDVGFVLGTTGPREGTEITSGAGGFVTFANVAPGPVVVDVTPPEGEVCAVFPALAEGVAGVDVVADTVTVLTLHCDVPEVEGDTAAVEG
jgi:hypothetical protein